MGKTTGAGNELTDPDVYYLRTNELMTWDENTLWRTYTILTDLEAVFRSLKSELGIRPVYHQKEERTEGHLFITVLAYQAVQVIRRKLKSHSIHELDNPAPNFCRTMPNHGHLQAGRWPDSSCTQDHHC